MVTRIRTVAAMKDMACGIRAKGGSIGLVPTMGALHEGHLSLVRRALSQNDHVVVSIFVNPTQFGQGEDFNRYPRDLSADVSKLESVGAPIIFAPEAGDMYPRGYSTFITVEGITEGLCGASRPGHFRGVATVVAKLFAIVQPHRAYFGKKDAQQLTVIQRMVRDLDMDIEVVPCPIVREPDGLAMSSRNVFLAPDERRDAPLLHQALLEAEIMCAEGITDAGAIREQVRGIIGRSSIARIDYVEIVDAASLKPCAAVTEPSLLAVAVKFGVTRLIDNIELAPRT